MCVSHSSEERHIPGPALSDAVNRAWIKADYEPTSICNNYTGSDAADARRIPMQVRVKQVFTEPTGLDGKYIQWGINGCNLPARALPLWAPGWAYAVFAGAVDALDADQQTEYPIPY
ncbi:hypothetical protein DL766_003289 [Monosporascus sp. MC13-8B]|nr:hypothetical protein DL766_003289 [Monosporascus sp. MC13-8B]